MIPPPRAFINVWMPLTTVQQVITHPPSTHKILNFEFRTAGDTCSIIRGTAAATAAAEARRRHQERFRSRRRVECGTRSVARGKLRQTEGVQSVWALSANCAE